MDNIKLEIENGVIAEPEMQALCKRSGCRIISVDTSADGMSIYTVGSDNEISFYALGEGVGRRLQKIFNY